MRVVLLGNTIPPDRVGGLPRYLRELACALARAGCEVVLVVRRVEAAHPHVEDASDGVRIIRHASPSKRNPLFAAAQPLYTALGVHAALRSTAGPDAVIHAHFPVPALPLAIGGTPYLYTFHAPVWRELLDEHQGTYALPRGVQRPAVEALRAFEGLVIRRATETFVLSEFMRSQLHDLDATAASRAQLLRGGIDIDRMRPDPAVARADRGSPVLFAARRLTPRTGVDRLIAAMPEVLRAHPEATLALAGTGEMEPTLRALASNVGVAERVTFLGHISDHSLLDWYRRATLVVMPTVSLEGFGLTAAEALACGTPVLGTPVGALPELLQPLDPTLVSIDSTPHGLASAINRLLVDPPRLASIGARSRDHVAPRMGWAQVARSYLEAYERAISSSRRRAAALWRRHTG